MSSRENRGIPKTANELLAMARGQYIARMDADDIATAHRLSIQVGYLQDHPAVVCVGGYFDLIDEAGRYLTTLRPPVRDDEIQSLLLKGHAAIQNSTAMMRRDALDRCGDYDERFPSPRILICGCAWVKLANWPISMQHWSGIASTQIPFPNATAASMRNSSATPASALTNSVASKAGWMHLGRGGLRGFSLDLRVHAQIWLVGLEQLSAQNGDDLRASRGSIETFDWQWLGFIGLRPAQAI